MSELDRNYAEKLEKIKENSRDALDRERRRAEGCVLPVCSCLLAFPRDAQWSQLIPRPDISSRYKTKAQEAQKRGKALTETALAAAASSYGLA